MVADAEVALQTKDFGIADIGPVEERAEEEKGENRQYSVGSSVTSLPVEGDCSTYLVSSFHRICQVSFLA